MTDKRNSISGSHIKSPAAKQSGNNPSEKSLAKMTFYRVIVELTSNQFSFQQVDTFLKLMRRNYLNVSRFNLISVLFAGISTGHRNAC